MPGGFSHHPYRLVLVLAISAFAVLRYIFVIQAIFQKPKPEEDEE